MRADKTMRRHNSRAWGNQASKTTHANTKLLEASVYPHPSLLHPHYAHHTTRLVHFHHAPSLSHPHHAQAISISTERTLSVTRKPAQAVLFHARYL